MDTQTPQPGCDGYEASRSTYASFNTSLLGTQQERRHQLIHRDAAKEPTNDITQYVHFKIVRKTGSRKNQKQHTIGSEYIHTVANERQLTI